MLREIENSQAWRALKDFSPQDITWLGVRIRLLIRADIEEDVNFCWHDLKFFKQRNTDSLAAYIIWEKLHNIF